MSNQSDWAAQTAATRADQAKKNNARKAANAKKEKDKKTSSLKTQINNIQVIQINPAKNGIKDLEFANVPLIRAYADAKAAGANSETLITLIAPVDFNYSQIAKYKTRITTAEAQIKQIKKQISDLNPVSSLFFPGSKKQVAVATKGAPTSIKNGQYLNGDGKKKAFSKDYMYNAPMVNAAYFGSQSFQDNIIGNNRVDPGAYTDARNAWSGVTGGRGTIQMDKKLIQTMEPQLSSKGDDLDLQKYGFKFLYNPTTVSMAWGLMNYMDPPYEAAGKDAFAPVSAGLMTSTVDFELILNRIEDFNHLNENGLDGFNPYAITVPNGDLKSIYRKGTMYDMEYLLKTLNGPSAQFKSELNGVTSDRAWLRPTIVELHLGNAMRYRVRIANLSINHIMFNSRMVPILSSVKITCSRFNDGPTAMPAGVGPQSPGANLTILRNTVPGYGR